MLERNILNNNLMNKKFGQNHKIYTFQKIINNNLDNEFFHKKLIKKIYKIKQLINRKKSLKFNLKKWKNKI